MRQNSIQFAAERFAEFRKTSSKDEIDYSEFCRAIKWAFFSSS